MRTYHPESWSQQARHLGDRIIENVNCGAWSVEQALYFFTHSYRHPRIRYRALKRFTRARRAGKICESTQAKLDWEEYKKDYLTFL